MDHLRKALEKSDAGASSTVRDWMQPVRNGASQSAASAPAVDIANTRVARPSSDTLAANRLIAASEDNPAVLDRYRLLRTRLQQVLKQRNWSVVGITSSAPEAGKTLTTLNLAITFARAETTRVIVVDADLRKSSIGPMFGIQPEFGLADYLSGDAELSDILCTPEGFENFSLIPGTGARGAGLHRPSELLASPRFDTLIKSLRATDAVIFIDTPPLQIGDDVLSVARKTDCFLLVVEEGKTTVQDLKEAATLLHDHNLVGTVLNKSSTQPKNFQAYYTSGEKTAATKA